MDDYAVLGLPATADRAAVRSAYKRLRATAHPDLHGGSAEATERFKNISTAYRRLDALLARINLEVPLHVQLGGGLLNFILGERRFRVAVPAHTPLGAVLRASSEDADQEVVVSPLAPPGWRLRDSSPDGALVQDLLVTWLAAYRGDQITVGLPEGGEGLLQLPAGSDTDMQLSLPGRGLLTARGRGPAVYRLRLIAPPAGSRRLIDALEEPWE